MSRNRKKAIELLFDLIKIKFDLSPSSELPSDFDQPRWVYGEKNEEDWLSNCIIKSKFEVSHERQFAIIEYQSTCYFVAAGLEEPDNIPVGLNSFPLNAGLFTTIVTELELPVRTSITNLYLEENILSQHKGVDLYIGHDFNDLITIFPNITIAEITNQFIGDSDNIEQIICSYLTVNKKFISLSLSTETLNKINELILLNSKILSYESIIQSLLSSHFKFSFLDLYRCIEMLYQIMYVDDTYKALSLTISKTDFLLAIDEKLNWRPNERNALKKLFAETPEAYKVEIHKAIKLVDNQIRSYSDWLYDLRCSIVHLKSTHKKFDLKVNEWNQLILGIAQLTTYWYQKYQVF